MPFSLQKTAHQKTLNLKRNIKILLLVSEVTCAHTLLPCIKKMPDRRLRAKESSYCKLAQKVRRNEVQTT